MTTTNGTPTAAETLQETSMHLMDATNWAADIVNTAINMRAHTRLSGAALRLWEAAVPLFETERWSGQHRQAIKLSLDALIMQPEVLAWVAREARDHLVKVEAAETTPAPTKITWLQDGQKALAVIRALEAGTPGDDTIAYVRTCGEKTMVLGQDGQLWTMDTDASAGQAFSTAETRDAAEVRRLYHFFWPIAWAELCELAVKRGADERAEAAEGLDAGDVTPLEQPR
jgi:hypothetical protein